MARKTSLYGSQEFAGVKLEEAYASWDIEEALKKIESWKIDNDKNKQNHAYLDKYINNNRNKCFKARNCTFGDIICLNYNSVYALIYSITYNVLYVMELSACDNAGYMGYFGSSTLEWDVMPMNEGNIEKYIAYYFALKLNKSCSVFSRISQILNSNPRLMVLFAVSTFAKCSLEIFSKSASLF